jgi:deoxyribose-phosphate aldolase
VCVNPVWVSVAARAVHASGVAVCAVVGFPLGANTTAVKVAEARRALEDGAREIDMVLPLGALRSGDLAMVGNDIASVATVVMQNGGITKVILETALLTDQEKVAACHLALDAGATFVKTSTGFGPSGATVADVRLLAQAVGGRIGVKASGGIRDLATARAMIAAGATRIGTSAGLALLSALHTEAASGVDSLP